MAVVNFSKSLVYLLIQIISQKKIWI